MLNSIKYIIAFVALGLSINLKAQSSDSTAIGSNIFAEDIQTILPPLRNLLDSAEVNSPLLKILDADLVIQQLRVKIAKRNWMSFFGIDGSVRHGLFDNLVISQDLGINDLNTNTTQQTRYSAGIYVRVPIYEFFNTMDREIVETERIKLLNQRESTAQELRKLVIVQYNNVLSAHGRFLIRNEAYESRRIQNLMIERQFKSGNIKIEDYAQQKEYYTNAKLQLEQNKIELLTAIQILQETVGIKFNIQGI